MGTATTPAELLDLGADVQARNGLMPNQFYEAGPRPPRECRVCPRGALAVAAGRHPEFAAMWPMYCDAFDPDVDSDENPPESDAEGFDMGLITSAESALALHLLTVVRYVPRGSRPRTLTEVIEEWADEDGRTVEEITAAMRGAAAALRKRTPGAPAATEEACDG